LMIALMFATTIAVNAAEPNPAVKVLSARMDIVYLKVPVDLVGAELSVFDSTGTKLFDLSVTNRKVLVDFINEKPGDYVIHIERCNHSEEVKYHKV
jgi:hypothetical protein